MKTWSGERGARILLVDSQVVLPAFPSPGGARGMIVKGLKDVV